MDARDPLPLMMRVADVLSIMPLRIATEAVLQADIDALLRRMDGAAVEREVALSTKDRIDFLVGDRLVTVGIEVKIGGSFADVTRQLYRYAEHDRIDGLLLVTSKRALIKVPEAISGKPVRSVHVGAFV